MKKIIHSNLLKIVLCLVLVISAVTVLSLKTEIKSHAKTYSGTCGDNLTWTLDTGTGVLDIAGSGDMKNYSYSSYVPWYSYRSSIKAVNIGNSVTSIGAYAFQNCSGLKSVTIPDSVTSIGAYAFQNCSGLTSVTIPDSVTSIGRYAFSGCSSLTSVTIGNGVTSIGDYAFDYCYKLVEVINKSSLKLTKGSSSNGYVAYYALEVHTGDSKVDNVDGYLFYTYNGINYLLGYTGSDKELVLPDNYEGQDFEIRKYAFSNCNSLTSITISDSVTSIGDSAFSNCSSLTSVTIPDSVTSIGSFAFYRCSSLTSITIPDSVTSIGSSAFFNCSSLTSITIPDSVTSIGSSAFFNCSSLTSITVLSGNMRYHSDGNCLIETSTKKLILGCMNSVIPSDDSVTSIGDSAFRDCSRLTSITIPDSVTSIGNSAFSGCTSLIQNENGVSYVDKWVIGYESSIKNAELRSDTVGIANGAFRSCNSITSITIPNSVTSIGDYAFSQCSSLTSITIPNSVTSIGDYAFNACRLTSIEIPDSVTWIGYQAFSYSSLKSVRIGNGVTSIGNAAFWYCSSLTSVTIPDSVTNIGDSAFRDCSSLISITIPDSVTSIGDSAFNACFNLTNITIPDSVTSIGNFALASCFGLETIYCEAASRPIGWEIYWIYGSSPKVIWGHKCKTDKEATCTEDSVCTECGKVIETATGHKEEFIFSFAPTCTETGFSEGRKCSVCGDILVATEVIPMIPHNYVNGFCTECGAKDPNPPVKNGFVTEDGNLYYYKNGVKQSGWITVDGVKYYASPKTNIVVSGKNAVIGTKQYFWNDETGLVLADGFYENEGTNTYASIDPTTGVATLVKVTTNGTICFEDGYLVYGWRHADGSPISVVDGIYEQYSTNPNDLYYFLSSSFTMVTDETYTLGGWKREFNADHTVKPLSGIQNYYGTMYYYVDGVAQGGWQTIGGNTYYFYKETGKAASMWMVIGGKVYYFYASTSATPYALKTSGSIGGISYIYGADGSITTTGFINTVAANTAGNNSVAYIQRKDGTTMYYENGERVESWKQINGNWYYFYKGTGYMCTESRTIGGVWYEFTADGVCTSR